MYLSLTSCRCAALNSCDEECPYTNSNGFRGRVCDPSCADGVPFGTNGCGAREGRHGDLCRACYIDVQRAQNNDGPDNRAIMYVEQGTVARTYAREADFLRYSSMQPLVCLFTHEDVEQTHSIPAIETSKAAWCFDGMSETIS